MHQELSVSKEERLTLALLRSKHAERGFSGECVVLFDPSHFTRVLQLPGFVNVENYRYKSRARQNEIGGVELFRMVAAGPIDYSALDIW